MKFIGIDPGVTGAVAVLDNTGRFIKVFDLPSVRRTTTTKAMKIDANELAKEISEFEGEDCIVMIEKVWAMPKQGASSGCSLGHSVGVCEGVCFAHKLRTHLIAPQMWKKHFKIGSDKELARAKAIEYFPAAPLGRKKDADRAEALLMARFMYETEAERASVRTSKI